MGDDVVQLRPAGGPYELPYGEAVLQQCVDGRVTVEQADDVIGVAGEMLAALAGNANPAAVRVTAEGHLELGTGGEVAYRPVRFVQESTGFIVLVCERVTGDG
jgi:hypothetical protein